MQKTGIKLQSAFTDNPLLIDKDEFRLVEGSNENGAKSKVYTKTKGNFYVKENPEAIGAVVFDKMVDVQNNL